MMSIEERKKQSQKMKLNNPMKRKEVRLKSSLSHMGNPGYWTGKHHSEKTKRKLSILNRKEKHPRWLGGVSDEGYPIKFNQQLKDKVKKRDHYTCQYCGSKKKLSIHHIDYNKKNCSLKNLIALCNSCHSKTNGNRDWWPEIWTKSPIIKIETISKEIKL